MLLTPLFLALALHRQSGVRRVYLDQLDLSSMSCGWGTPLARKSVGGGPIRIAGHVYARGVGTHAVSDYIVLLGGRAVEFHAVVGVDDEATTQGSVRFHVIVDGKEQASTPVMRKGTATVLKVNLLKAKKLELTVDDGGDGINYDHADWGDAWIETRGGLAALHVPATPDKLQVKINMRIPQKPLFNGPKIYGCGPGNPFLFRLPVSGLRPIKFAAFGLPPGLHLGSVSGIVTGSIDQAGVYPVRFEARNAKGTARRSITFVCGYHSLALTPPMGWNSWNVWAGAVDENKVKAAADTMVKTGLADFGFSYINIDDTWEAGRDAQGNIQSNARFPSLFSLSKYVHSLGLKLGIYSSPGPRTCGGYTGSYRHEAQDANSYARWGIDYLKYDWCSYGSIAKNNSLAELQKPYRVMRAALDSVPRDIVFSFCQYGMGDTYKWGAKLGGNLWRTTGDITDTWPSMTANAMATEKMGSGAGPGSWNDPDMLVVGWVGWGSHPRPSRLKPNEQLTHISLWAMLAAPLLLGCDMTRLNSTTLAMLENHDIISIDQDVLGIPGVIRMKLKDIQVWTRELSGGSTAVALVNFGTVGETVSIPLAQIGLAAHMNLRDAWAEQNLGQTGKVLKVEVPTHASRVFIVSKP